MLKEGHVDIDLARSKAKKLLGSGRMPVLTFFARRFMIGEYDVT